MKIQILAEEPTATTPKPPRRTWRGFLKWMAVCLVIQLVLHYFLGSGRGKPFSLELALSGGVGLGLSSYFWFKVLP